MNRDSLQKAVELAGGQSALAKKIGGKVRQGHVWTWLHRDEKAPAEYCMAIEAIVDGAVTRYDLRPDVFGAKPAGDRAA